MFLTEAVKKFISTKKKKNPSSIVNPQKIINNLSDDGYIKQSDFFDYQEDHFTGTFTAFTVEEIVKKQAERIRLYRQVAMYPDVFDALDIICNEIIFSYDDFPLKLDVKLENNQVEKAVHACFDRIIKIANLDKNLFNVIKNTYIDGQCILHCTYDEKNQKKGIQSIRMLDPIGLYYDNKIKKWKYLEMFDYSLYYTNARKDEEYDVEEIVRTDFGLYDEFICLSYLEQAIKAANMLKSAEDLIIPLRFSRSISRRVFNVDVGNIPGKRAEEYMKKIQEKFKYKKFYNNDTGEISNQQHITSMVEDYWFANRSGSKGTTVDTLDETGNLGQLDDIIYLAKKMYRALKIPVSKLDIDPDSDHSFSWDSTETTQEDLKFMMFISRIRTVYTNLIKELLRREVLSMKVLTEKDWNSYEDNIVVSFANENLFIEKLKLEVLKSKIESWQDMKEVGGTIFTFNELMKRVFGMNDNEIKKNLKAIEKEKKSGKYDIFYKLADLEIASETGMAGMTDANGNPMDADDMEIGLFTDDDDEDEDKQSSNMNDTNKESGESNDSTGSSDSDNKESPKISDYFKNYKLD